MMNNLFVTGALCILTFSQLSPAECYGPPPVKGKKHRTTTTTEGPGQQFSPIPDLFGNSVAPAPGTNYIDQPTSGSFAYSSSSSTGFNNLPGSSGTTTGFWWQGPNSPFNPANQVGPVPSNPGQKPLTQGPAQPSGGCGGPTGCVGVGYQPTPTVSAPNKPIDIQGNPFLSSALGVKPNNQPNCQGNSCGNTPGGYISATIKCTLPEHVCVPKSVCYNGQVSENGIYQVRQGAVECNANEEACCRLSTIPGSGNKPSYGGTTSSGYTPVGGGVPASGHTPGSSGYTPGTFGPNGAPSTGYTPESSGSFGSGYKPGAGVPATGQTPGSSPNTGFRPGPAGTPGLIGGPGTGYTPGISSSPGFNGAPSTGYTPSVSGTHTPGSPGSGHQPGTSGTSYTPGISSAPNTGYQPGTFGSPGFNGAPSTSYTPGVSGPQTGYTPSTVYTPGASGTGYKPGTGSSPNTGFRPGSEYNPSASQPGTNGVPIGGSIYNNPTPRPVVPVTSPRPYTGPLNTTPYPGCAAALKCVQESYCTADGVMSNTPVFLTREQLDNKVPLTDCLNMETGIIGKCCRDPNYKDPWPAGMMMMKNQGFDDGQYHPDASATTNHNAGLYYNSVSSTPSSVKGHTIKKPLGVFGQTPAPFPVTYGSSSSGTGSYSQSSSFPFNGQPAVNGQPKNPQGSYGRPGQGSPSALPGSFGQPQQPGNVGQPNFPGQNPPGNVGQPNFPGQNQPGTIGQPNFPVQVQQPGTIGQPSFPGQVTTGFPNQPGSTYQPQPKPQPSFEQKPFPPPFPGNQSPTPTPAVSTSYGSTQPSVSFPEQSQLPDSSYQPGVKPPQPGTSCGVRKESYDSPIDAGFAEFPWQVLIVSATNRSALCSGAIISDNAVITAAHCVEGSVSKDILVKAGEWKLSSQEHPKPVQVRTVVAISRHPQFNTASLSNDLAILVIGQPFTFDEHVDKICLPSSSSPEYQPTGRTCVVTGWGKFALQGNSPSAVLHKVNVNYLPAGQCEAKLKQTHLGKYFILNQGFTCAVPSSGVASDLCQVDIGGPLACDRGDGHYELAGVNSWDIGCEQDVPTVFATCDSSWVYAVLAKPPETLITEEQQYNDNKHKGESLEGVDIDDKPGFALGYGKK